MNSVPGLGTGIPVSPAILVAIGTLFVLAAGASVAQDELADRRRVSQGRPPKRTGSRVWRSLYVAGVGLVGIVAGLAMR